MISRLIDDTDNVVYADGAYSDKPVADSLPSNVRNYICEQRTKKKPLTAEQVANNHLKSKIKSCIERVFRFMSNSVHGLALRSIGLIRASFNNGLTSLIYCLFSANSYVVAPLSCGNCAL